MRNPAPVPWNFRRGRTPKLCGFLLALASFLFSPARAELAVSETGQVSAGATHTLVVRSDGTVWAWGKNNLGQLGDGTTALRTAPVQVAGLEGVVAVSAGRSHSLALTKDGTVWAWGDNSSGELGDGTTVPRLRPVQVNNLSGIIAIAAGGRFFSVALKDDGTVCTWGENAFGQLGDGTNTPRLRPVAVPGLDGVMAISAGRGHVLALRRDGSVFAWGWNGIGQLGDGTQIDRTRPVRVLNVNDAIAISAGSLTHSLALRSDGRVLAWGNNYSGQLGEAALPQRTTATLVPGLGGIVAISAGSSHNVAITGGGAVCVWGSNLTGQLNLLTPLDHIRATHPDNWPQDTAIFSAGGDRTVVLTQSGKVLSVGAGESAQWGDGTILGTTTVFTGNAEVQQGLIEAPCPWTKTASEWHEARGFSAR
jgi:alpha-tubulin suppressor-like RCC1 family protein